METLGRGTRKSLPNLRRIRKARGFSLNDLDKLSEVDKATISRLENGVSRGTRDTIRRLARALKVTPEELMSEEPPEPKTGLEGDADEAENLYLGRFALANEGFDDRYEAGLVEAYLRIVDAEGRTDEAIRRIVQRALNVGKARGKELA